MIIKLTNIQWADGARFSPGRVHVSVEGHDPDEYVEEALTKVQDRCEGTILDADVTWESDDDTSERLKVIQEWLAANPGNEWISTTAKIKTRELLNLDRREDN